MVKKLITLITLASLSLSLPLIPANAAVKAGGACKKVGVTSVAVGKTYKCIKTGKKLVWQLNSKNSAATQSNKPVAILPTSELSDPKRFLNLESCKIKHLNPHATSMVAGFPIVDRRVNLVKGLKAQIIGVDFPDRSAGVLSVKEANEVFISSTEKFWGDQATVPVKFEWNWKNEWIRMPNPIKSYDLGGSFFEGKFRDDPYWSFVRTVISMADTTVDFTGVNFIFIVFPPLVKVDEIGSFLVHTQGTYSTAEGNIYNLILAGGTYVSSEIYIHEFGHGLGLTDIRDATNLGDQKSDGMYYDTMNNPWVPELLVWHRFLLGILNDKQIHCITSNEASTHWIVPVASKSEMVKGVVIPLSDTEGVIIESRRAIGWDKALRENIKVYEKNARDLVGAVVYTLDTSVPYRKTPVKVVKVLNNQDSIIVRGYKITLIESGDFGDVIRVEKV
jgi:hypothetical protein